MRLSRTHRAWLYACGLLLFTSGVAWLVFHYFVIVETKFGHGHSPLEAWCLKLHGLALMAMLVVVGSLLPAHVFSAWRVGRARLTGSLLLGIATWLCLTGYALYYFSNEETRIWIGVAHWAVGLLTLPILLIHILRRHRKSIGRVRRIETGAGHRHGVVHLRSGDMDPGHQPKGGRMGTTRESNDKALQ